jgi:type IV fimbrial biogenesis protein FimT
MQIPTTKKQAGVTLIELMFSLLILAVLMSVSAPALGNLIDGTRSRGARGTLLTSLNLARMMAVNVHRDVIVCPSRDLASCDDGMWWQNGWIVFEDTNGNRKRDAGEPLLETVQAQPGIAIATTSGRKLVRFRADGSASGTDLTYTICDHRGAKTAASVVVSNPGRIREGAPDPARAAETCAAVGG